jgi:hypothetical protein
VRIDHRGTDVGVAEQLLHRTDVIAVFKQLRRKRMSECVRTHALCDSGVPRGARDRLPGRRTREDESASAAVSTRNSIRTIRASGGGLSTSPIRDSRTPRREVRLCCGRPRRRVRTQRGLTGEAEGTDARGDVDGARNDRALE